MLDDCGGRLSTEEEEGTVQMCGGEGMVVVQERDVLKLRGASSIQQTVIARHVRVNSCDPATTPIAYHRWTSEVLRSFEEG